MSHAKRFVVTEVWVRQRICFGLSETEVLEKNEPGHFARFTSSKTPSDHGLSLSNWHAIEVPEEPKGKPDMVCEEHPDLAWPHDDCPGPGMPPQVTGG